MTAQPPGTQGQPEAASTGHYALDERLPTDVVMGGSLPWTRYRQYPVFSGRWFMGRSLLFGAVILAFALLSGFGVGFAGRDYRTGALVAGYTFAAFMAMALAGPALAMVVRHRRWPLPRERVGVVLAVLLGIGASFLADRWASGYIDAHVERALMMPARTDGQAGGREAPLATAPSPEELRRRLREAPPAERMAALAVNVLVGLTIYGLFGGGLALRAYFGEQRRWRESMHRNELRRVRDRQREAEIRLGVLQAQVEPHFLFNTLAAVRALLREKPAHAEATLDALVAYLRASIPRMRGEAPALEGTLGDQIDLCVQYLEVMRLRSGDRLRHAVRVPDALRALPFPPLLLLTLVENAVKHGVEPKPGAGCIELEAETRDGRLHVRVLDDGVGLSANATGGGLGLANVREQLAARYGDRAGLRLRNRTPQGTLAELVLPMESP